MSEEEKKVFEQIVNYEKEVDKLKDVRSGKIKEGLKLNIPKIDEHYRFKYGNFNVILGHANVGKTTVILYLMLLYSLKHNLKWLVLSSENEAYSLIRKLIEYICVKPINLIDDKMLNISGDFINKHFKFIDNNNLYTYRDLISIGTHMKKVWNYDGFLVDPYNSLIKDRNDLKHMNGHDYDYTACSHFRIFCRQNNVSVWLNTHANTEALRKRHHLNHQYAEHPIPPMASDVEGGGKFVNRADDFAVIHRYIQHPTDWMYTHIHIRKVKDVDTGGRPTSIDAPIKIKSVINNVGFEFDNINYILDDEQFRLQKLPF